VSGLWSLKISNQQSVISQIKGKSRWKKSFDKPVIRLSNDISPFVCKNIFPRVGVWLKDAGRGLQEIAQNRRKCQKLAIERQNQKRLSD